MTAQTILPANTLSSGYDVANSLRFNSGSSDRLNKTLGTPTNNLKFTYSFWIKRSKLGEEVAVTEAINNSQNKALILFRSDDQLEILDLQSDSYVMQKKTSRKFRDVSAWYHIVFSNDSTAGSPDLKLYVNGVEETSWATDNEYSQNEASLFNSALANHIGASASSRFINGYFSEFVFIDGQALAADQFGEFDSDSPTIWKPKDVSGLTFGDNGFYFEFKGSGTSANSSGLGADTSGNDSHFTVNNLTATHQTTDTCTNNFCTINALDNFFEAGTLEEGNCKYTANTGRASYITSTIGVGSGRWYYEVLCSTEGSNSYKTVGFTPTSSTGNTNWFGEDPDHVSYYHSGKIYNNGSGANYGNAWAATDILGCYLDLTSDKAYFTKNGAIQNSGNGYDISGAAFDTGPFWFCTVGMPAAQSPGTVLQANFGNPSFAISSSNADDNGYGNFEYSPNITGDGAAKSFYAICTKNLAEFG